MPSIDAKKTARLSACISRKYKLEGRGRAGDRRRTRHRCGLRRGSRRSGRQGRHRRYRRSKVAEEGRDALKAKGHEAEIVLMNVTDPTRVTEVAECARRSVTASSTSWSTMPASLDPRRRPRRPPTSIGSTSSTSISTASSGAAAPSAGICSSKRSGLDRQYRLDVGLHRQQAAGAELLQRLQGRRASPDQVARGRMGDARGAGQRGGADLYQHAAQPPSRKLEPEDVPDTGST